MDKYNKKMIIQARQTSLTQMLSNMAHQWKQPLTELNLNLYNMKRSVGDLEKIDAYFLQSKELIKSISNTIDEFTNFFTPEKEMQVFNIKLSIIEALKLLDDRLNKSMVEITYDLNDAKVFGVQNELNQIIVNLLNNSIDAFEKNGVLLRQINIQSKYDDENIILSFEDNAGGVSKKNIEKVFEPYFTTKYQKNGTGLGLFMSKMICEQGMGGAIELVSVKGNTRLEMILPKAKEPIKAQANESLV